MVWLSTVWYWFTLLALIQTAAGIYVFFKSAAFDKSSPNLKLFYLFIVLCFTSTVTGLFGVIGFAVRFFQVILRG